MTRIDQVGISDQRPKTIALGEQVEIGNVAH
jgi:hypothetical protein